MPPISTIEKTGYTKPWKFPTTGVGVTLSPINSGGFTMFGGNAIFSPNTTYYTKP